MATGPILAAEPHRLGCACETSRFIFLLYGASVAILLDLRLTLWLPDQLAVEAEDMIDLLNYVTMLLLGWILWLSAKVTYVRTKREQGVSL